ncbi:MAG: DotU family type IV/VI secretion system protein [Puniceicoccales bacterium]|jgi:type VI protein secretion system component VasF|nr:DotU family type IV/VI secretion system protein [Puniceicoccales bacterium]
MPAETIHTNAAPLTLPVLCEPIFQEVCRLNRLARVAPAGDLATAKAEIKAIFQKMADRAKNDPTLLHNYEKVELALLFFTDSMLAESTLPYAKEWDKARLAYERNELAGDEKFFDLLDETLADTKDTANERLVIFYTCIGLGFTGWYQGQNEWLRKKMKEIQPRIRKWVDTDETGLISPESYKHTNLTDFRPPVGSMLIPMLIVAVALVFVAVTANIILFKNASADLSKALDVIFTQDGARKASAPKPEPAP